MFWKNCVGELVCLAIQVSSDVLELDRLYFIRQDLVAFEQGYDVIGMSRQFAFEKADSQLTVSMHNQFLYIVAVSVSHKKTYTYHLGFVIRSLPQCLCPRQEDASKMADEVPCRGRARVAFAGSIEESFIRLKVKALEWFGFEVGGFKEAKVHKDFIHFSLSLLANSILNRPISFRRTLVLSQGSFEVVFKESELGGVGYVSMLLDFGIESFNGCSLVHKHRAGVLWVFDQSPLCPSPRLIHFGHLQPLGAKEQVKSSPHPNYNQQ